MLMSCVGIYDPSWMSKKLMSCVGIYDPSWMSKKLMSCVGMYDPSWICMVLRGHAVLVSCVDELNNCMCEEHTETATKSKRGVYEVKSVVEKKTRVNEDTVQSTWYIVKQSTLCIEYCVMGRSLLVVRKKGIYTRSS